MGISLENAGLADADTAVEREKKLTKARQVLVGFTAKNEMPWPQYFDGKYRQNAIAGRLPHQRHPRDAPHR